MLPGTLEEKGYCGSEGELSQRHLEGSTVDTDELGLVRRRVWGEGKRERGEPEAKRPAESQETKR